MPVSLSAAGGIEAGELAKALPALADDLQVDPSRKARPEAAAAVKS